MSGGSQHNPNGRQSQLGSGWSPLQLQMASYLARAPQAHMASERGVTWHTPTPPHLYHVPAPSPPDPLQAMKVTAAAGNSVFRHTATPPELFRHTPTPPDKHLMRHTPSPGDVKAGASLPPADLFTHLGQARVADKLRHEELVYRGGGGGGGAGGGGGGGAGGGVDLSVSRAPAANGSPIALSVRDAPTINSLIGRAAPPVPPQRSRVDCLLERLAPSPHSVIVHPRPAHTPPAPTATAAAAAAVRATPPLAPAASPPASSGEDETCAYPAPKRKRKPERVVRVPAPRLSPPKENGLKNGPEPADPVDPVPRTRRKTRSGSAETIDDIAAMIASKEAKPTEPDPEPEAEPPVSIDKLESVLASPNPAKELPEVSTPAPAPPPTPTPATLPEPEIKKSPPKAEEQEVLPETPVAVASAPKRRTRAAHSESANVPVESPSEAKPAEPETSEQKSAEPTPASIVDVEDQLEKMFAGIEETEKAENKGKKRRKSVPTKGEKKCSRRSSRASTGDETGKKKPGRKKAGKVKKNNEVVKEYDSGSNASSGRSRGPYIQIRGPRDSPLSVSVINAAAGEEEERAARAAGEYRAGGRARGRGRGLHCSTLGLRYDATTPDASWLCAFCRRGPHARALGDLFGPYTLSTDSEHYRALDEHTKALYTDPVEVWFHVDCALWAPGVLARGARVWGLEGAVWGAAEGRCACGREGAPLACAARRCPARAHLPCARDAWCLQPDQYRAYCPLHAPESPPS